MDVPRHTSQVDGAEDPGPRPAASRLLRAGLLTGVTDGLFAVALAFVYGSSFTRLWQGVASVPFGRAVFEGGTRTVALGLALHFVTAFFWSAVFVFVVARAEPVQRWLGGWPGLLAVAALYGPLIWAVMSLAVIPAFTGRPPHLGFRWWIQLLGHFPFVGLPILWGAGPWRTVPPSAR